MTKFEETKCISVGFSCQDIFCVNEGWIFVFCKEKKIEEQKSTPTSTMGLKKKFFCSNRIICIAVQNFTKYLCFDFFVYFCFRWSRINALTMTLTLLESISFKIIVHIIQTFMWKLQNILMKLTVGELSFQK